MKMNQANRGDGQIYATPASRRIAREKGLDLSVVQGSGPQGRIQAHDILTFTDAAAQPSRMPLVGMRRKITERMTSSYQHIPHIRLTVRVDMSRFIQVRQRLSAHGGKTSETVKLYLARCCA